MNYYELSPEERVPSAERAAAELARREALDRLRLDPRSAPPIQWVEKVSCRIGLPYISHPCDIYGMTKRDPLRVFVRSGVGPARVADTVGHEYTHVRQYAAGELDAQPLAACEADARAVGAAVADAGVTGTFLRTLEAHRRADRQMAQLEPARREREAVRRRLGVG